MGSEFRIASVPADRSGLDVGGCCSEDSGLSSASASEGFGGHQVLLSVVLESVPKLVLNYRNGALPSVTLRMVLTRFSVPCMYDGRRVDRYHLQVDIESGDGGTGLNETVSYTGGVGQEMLDRLNAWGSQFSLSWRDLTANDCLVPLVSGIE